MYAEEVGRRDKGVLAWYCMNVVIVLVEDDREGG